MSYASQNACPRAEQSLARAKKNLCHYFALVYARATNGGRLDADHYSEIGLVVDEIFDAVFFELAHRDACERCDGTGEITTIENESDECPACHGTKRKP